MGGWFWEDFVTDWLSYPICDKLAGKPYEDINDQPYSNFQCLAVNCTVVKVY